MASPLIVKGIKRVKANRYDYVSVSIDSEIITICAREGGETAGGWADLTPDGARKLIAALELALAGKPAA